MPRQRTSQPDGSSDLAKHFQAKQEFRGHLALSGLFSGSSPKVWDYFKGRIIFPYWKNGKVVNMTGRATTLTPADNYECYVGDEGNVKVETNGQPMYIKYKKLRRHDPNDEKRKHISRFIGLETFMGMDVIRGKKQVIITEGAPDWVSAVDNGIPAISPVTTNFRKEDFEKLALATAGAEVVYIINDNEDNKAGLTGALNTGKYLTAQGRNVFLVELPKPQGISKIDLNEYLKDHNADELRTLATSSKSVLDILIEKLPEDFVKALPALKQEILPLLIGLEDSIREHYLDGIRKRSKTTKTAIMAEFEAVRKIASAGKKESNQPPIEPAVQTAAEQIAKDPMLVRKRIDVVNQSGVVGERKVIAMYFSALDSRLLPEDNGTPTALALKNAGHHGSGKSFTLKRCLAFYPEDGYHEITGGSAKSLYYLSDGLKHRALIMAEAFQFQTENAGDSEFVYVVRSLLSEGRVTYQVSEKDEDGKFKTVERRLDGPTSFITTTIIDKLETQLEDRLFTIHPDESMAQTRSIMSMTALVKAGNFEGIDKQTTEAWKCFHSMLKPIKVVVPFAARISQHIQRGPLPIATRRAFNRVMSIIQTVACAYQFQRSKDSKGQLVSEMADYWMALQIVREAFRETLGQQSQETLHRIDFIREKGPIQYTALAAEWGVSKAALTAWVRGRTYDNLLAWCNEDGYEFVDEKDLKRAKHSGVAYLKVNDNFIKEDRTGLPSPFELTADPRWNESGDLYKLYDLELDQRSHGSGIQPVQKPEFKFPTFEPEEESEDTQPDINRASMSLEDLGIQTF